MALGNVYRIGYMYKRYFFSAALLGFLLVQLQLVRAETPVVSSNQKFEHRQLTDFVRLVINNHPRVRSIDASLQASSARSRAADQPLYNPELEIEAERTDIDTTSIGISQTVDWSDKRGARAKTAGHLRTAAIAEAESQRQELMVELLKALGEFHTANDLNEQGQRRLQLMQQFSNIAEKRYRAGDLNQIELDLAKLAYLEASLDSSELASRLSDAEQVLLSLLGEHVQPINWPALPPSQSHNNYLDNDSETLLRRHPLFRVQQARIAAARSSIQERQREARPDPTISIRAGREDKEDLTGLSLSVPLFVRNNYNAEVDEANANSIQAEQDAQTAWLDLKSEFNTAARRYTLTKASWSKWQQLGKTSLNRRVDLLEKIWQAGELNTTDYLVQVKQTLDTQSAATELRGRLWVAWLDWLSASGTVSQWLNIDGSQADIANQK